MDSAHAFGEDGFYVNGNTVSAFTSLNGYLTPQAIFNGKIGEVYADSMAGVQGSDFYYRVPSDPDTVLFLADENSGLNGSIRSSNWVELNNGI